MKTIEYIDLKRRLEKTYWIVPASIRFDSSIDPVIKIFYASLFALSNHTGKLKLTNVVIAYAVNLPLRTVERYIAILVSKKYLKITTINRVREIALLKLNDSAKGKFSDETNLYAVTPGIVGVSEHINGLEKMLYVEILALTRAVGFCFASYETIAGILNIDMRKFYRALKNLIDVNFVQKGYTEDGKKILLVRYSNVKEHEYMKLRQVKPRKKREIKESTKNDYQTIQKLVENIYDVDVETEKALEKLYKLV